MPTVEDIRAGADGELNKKLLTQFVPADKKLSLFHSSPISPWGKRHEIVSFLFGNLRNKLKKFTFLLDVYFIMRETQEIVSPLQIWQFCREKNNNFVYFIPLLILPWKKYKTLSLFHSMPIYVGEKMRSRHQQS